MKPHEIKTLLTDLVEAAVDATVALTDTDTDTDADTDKVAMRMAAHRVGPWRYGLLPAMLPPGEKVVEVEFDGSLRQFGGPFSDLRVKNPGDRLWCQIGASL